MSGEGGGFDPCECVWGHELAMRRLLNVLRNSQALCTDSECYVDDVTPRHTQSPPDQALLMSIMVITVIILYFFRPRLASFAKANRSGNNPRNPPPTTN